MKFGPLNFSDPGEILRAAEIHEKAPLNWDPCFVVSTERIQSTFRFLKSAENDPSVFVLCARDGDDLVGLHWVRLTEKHGQKCGHIGSLWVSEKFRKQGIGRELKTRGEEWAKSQGAEIMATQVFYSNKKMIDFNVKLGFAPLQVEMVKNLGP